MTTDRQQPRNVVTLAIEPKLKPARKKHRFRIIEFIHHTGSKSWRVDGYKPDRSRVRENFVDLKTAQCRQLELEAQALKQPLETAVRATKLSEEALRVCEFACFKLGGDWARLPDVVDFWLKAGGKSIPVDGPRIDDAIAQYLGWLEKSSNLRVPTQKGRRVQLNVFRKAVPNVRVLEIDPEFVERYLDGRKVGPVTKNFINRQLSVFFGWCVQRPRRWMIANPCREIKIDTGEKSAPKILTVQECRAILSAAEAHKDGRTAPYLAVCLFGGLRPTEAWKLEWKQVNLDDNEICLDATQTKTKKGRVVKIHPTLAAWLEAYKNQPFHPLNWRKEFNAVKAAGPKTWTPDIMRHTAISHYFRQCGSYGFCAEQFGNSEAVIRAHYQGRVSSEETKAFYQIMPTKGRGK